MSFLNTFLLLLVCTVFGAVSTYHVKATPPVFSNQYTVGGIIELPYAEIKEPFTAYYDAVNKRSRIDYYGNVVVTIQRADMTPYGYAFKVASMTTDKVYDQETCFQVNGTATSGVNIQTVLPNLQGFQYDGQETVGTVLCNKWQNVVMIGEKKNTYIMWVNAQTNAPIKYEMMGYDTLIGSHYDKYYLTYFNYQTAAPPESDFIVPDHLKCGPFPGPGASSEHVVLMNPMHEYINQHDAHIHQMFDEFKHRHNKAYVTSMEHEQRKHHFRQNVRFIHSKNREQLSYTLAVNHLAAHSESEMKTLRGYYYTPGDHGGLPFDMSQYKLTDIPDHFDWRLRGAVTQVKDQAICGSCWSFGTVGTIEGAYFLKTGNLVRLSQQELMDCSWGEGNNACDGGEDFRSYNWIMKNGGLTSEDQYGMYTGQDGICHSKTVTAVAQLTGFVNVTPYDENALKVAIATKGPISVAIDASHKSLSFYANGVYYEPNCGSKPEDLDHAVLAVGYGTLNDQAYWLIKNSWSTYWGNAGYVLMSQKDNNCGVATSPTYTIIK